MEGEIILSLIQMMYMIIQFNSQLCEKKSVFKHSIRFVTGFSKHNMYNVTGGN